MSAIDQQILSLIRMGLCNTPWVAGKRSNGSEVVTMWRKGNPIDVVLSDEELVSIGQKLVNTGNFKWQTDCKNVTKHSVDDTHSSIRLMIEFEYDELEDCDQFEEYDDVMEFTVDIDARNGMISIDVF